jgi:hypothetical protein
MRHKQVLGLAMGLMFTGLLTAMALPQRDGFTFHRASLTADKTAYRVAVEGLICSRNAVGGGTYTAAFAVFEDDPKFEYHQQRLFLLLQPPADGLDPTSLKGCSYVAIHWSRGGNIQVRHVGADGKSTDIGQHLVPGPDNPYAYGAGQVVTLQAVVTPEHELKIRLNPTRPDQAFACSFRLPESVPATGYYGFSQPKWFSIVQVSELTFSGVAAPGEVVLEMDDHDEQAGAGTATVFAPGPEVTDCTELLQQALTTFNLVTLAGSGDPTRPRQYPVRPGLVIPSGHTLRGSDSAELLRLPARGKLVRLEPCARIHRVIINGNKYRHYPEFEDLGKSDMGIQATSNCLVEECVVYDIPGCAFATYGDDNLFRACKAVNSGYIDLKFKADYYQGKWDRWSGDSFYIRGHNNIVLDCDSEDAFRWDYTTCHENSGNTVYVNCTGRDVRWRSYGFIDIEGCDGLGSVMINCKSPDGSIAISTRKSKLINCAAAKINIYNSDEAMVVNSETLGQGLAYGGWTSRQNQQIKGGKDPVIVGNVINRSAVTAGVPETADWSFTVFSDNQRGLVADNRLLEHKTNDGQTGPGWKFQGVKVSGNRLEYGQYTAPRPQVDPEIKKAAANRLARAKMMDFTKKLPTLLEQLEVREKVVGTVMAPLDVTFRQDPKKVGETEKWMENAPGDAIPFQIGQHWDNQIGTMHNQAGWYFIDLPLDMDLQHNCSKVFLLFEGVDSDCEVYLNGRKIGENHTWDKPFVFAVPKTELLWQDDARPNRIVVKAWTPGGLGGVYGLVAAILAE